MDLQSNLFQTLTENLRSSGFSIDLLNTGEVRLDTIAYMLYWYHRLSSKTDEQQKIYEGLKAYLITTNSIVDSLVKIEIIKDGLNEYVTKELLPVPTIDLVCMQGSKILCIKREFYPTGIALVGGFINDSDESNSLNLPASLFAALRIAGEKILKTNDPIYSSELDEYGNKVLVVASKNDATKIKIYPHDRYGYAIRENIKSTLRPADKRHIVNTVGFKCFVEGTITASHLLWTEKTDALSQVVFEHHREIISHVTAQSSLEQELRLQEKDFIRNMIEHPFETYKNIQKRFHGNKENINTSFPEFFPVVNRLLQEMYTSTMNDLCVKNPILIGIRDKATISLRHVSLKNRVFCPYVPTIRAIFESVAFFDIVARHQRSFYNLQPTNTIIEHNPKETAGVSYHMYRYKYRLDDMFALIPDEIIIPTFETLSVTDLMRVRGTPLRFIGLSTDFIYVDEFEQSPEEFLMHDCNHSWRMMEEDKHIIQELDISRDKFFKKQSDFIEDYLSIIKIQKTDTEEECELKKIKKIILFEIVHEDARPFLKETIGKYLQIKEGGTVPFEVPHIDPKTGYMDVVDTLDTGISTLSYVRNKLQHGFYDHVDAQLPQIVEPRYRKAKYIAQAAYDMLVELKIKPSKEAILDNKGHVSYEWLMQRTSSVGPDNIHEAQEDDEALAEFGDGIEKLNPKRYQA